MPYEGKSNEAKPAKSHALTLTERERMELSGVEEVVSFDDGQITIATVKGELCVRGEGLRVEKLDKVSGQMWLTGTVDELAYTRTVEGGFWSRLLR